MPKQLEGVEIYQPKPYGKEKALGERLAQLKQIKKEKNSKKD